jgi:hypothetical protein
VLEVIGLTVILAVVAPVFQEIVPEQLVTVSVALSPSHIVALLTDGVGFGFTVTLPVSVPLQVPTVQVAV